MPTYDYQCLTCGHRFEYFQSMSSDVLTHCPKSQCIQQEEEKKGTGEVVRKVSGGAGLLFKGEGFYQTDYVRKGGGKEGGGKEGGGASKSGSSKGGSSTEGSGTAGSGKEGGSPSESKSEGGSSSSGSDSGTSSTES